jgi:hypothetical protein
MQDLIQPQYYGSLVVLQPPISTGKPSFCANRSTIIVSAISGGLYLSSKLSVLNSIIIFFGKH